MQPALGLQRLAHGRRPAKLATDDGTEEEEAKTKGKTVKHKNNSFNFNKDILP